MAAGEIDIALELEADRMANLLLRKEDFDTERMVVVEERRLRTTDNPQARLTEELDAAAYMAHPYGWPVVGWLNDIQKLTLEDLRAYHDTYYRVNNAFLVIVGDFAPDAMLAKVERHFGKIKPGAEPPKMRAVEPPQQGERALTLEIPARLHTLVWGYHAPNITQPDGYGLEVLQAVLTAGESSRLNIGLVRKELAVEASADYSLLSKDPSLFYVQAQAMPGKDPAQVAEAMEREVARLQEQPLGAEELLKAKNQLEASFIRGQDSTFYQGMILAMYENTVEWRKVDDYLPGIRKVTPEQVQAAAKKYLTPENRTKAHLVPVRPPAGAPVPAPPPPAGKVIS
jgi:zinc protease